MGSRQQREHGIADVGHELPAPVKLAVAQRFGDVEPEAFACADVDPAGRFGASWALLVGGELAIVADGGRHPSAVRVTPLAGDVELEIVEGSGSSRFRIVRGGRLVEELRFSCRQARRFSRLLHRSRRRAGDEPERPVHEAAATDDEDKLCAKCGRLIPDWAESCPRCLHRRRVLWRLVAYVCPYRSTVFVGLGSAALVTGLQLVPPKLTQCLINDVLTPGPDQWPRSHLWWLIGVLAVVIVSRVFLQYLRLNRLARLGELVAHDLRVTAFAHLQKLSLAYYSKKPTGQLINRLTHDTDRLWDFIAFGMVDVLISALMVVGIAVILFLEEPVLAALTMAPIPVGIVLTYFHTLSMRRVLTRLWIKWGRMTSVLSDVIPGIRVVKAFTQESRERDRFFRCSHAVQVDAVDLHREWTAFWPKITLLLNVGTIIIWSYAAPRILDGKFDLGTFVMFLGYVWMFYGPIEELGMMNRVFQRAATSAHRIFEILDTSPTIYTKSSAVPHPRLAGAITFEHVSFAYDGVKRVLQDVSFHVEPGEMIGLAGPSGGGKTTLVNLICRFYDPAEGRILIDGTDVRDLDLQELRRQIGVVLQEPYLFCGTVAQNIAYASPDATPEQIITAARAANAHDFIVGFPGGYDTRVGERGQTVSGGERQRLSIARAVLTNPRVLILDEATSSVDSKTEMKIQQAINRLVAGRTTFAIAHRLSTLRQASRLFILDKGRLVEQGTHEQLVAAAGVYAKLHKTQSELHAMFAV